jgi:methyl-accepting chemotaxis protein
VFSRQSFIGFNTFGEELFTHHNQTLTAVFFGTPLEPGTLDPYKTKRLFHYADSKLKSLIFEIISRSELLNVTISTLDKSFAPISEYMKQGTKAFKQSTDDFLTSFTKTQGDIDSMDKGFNVITTEFGNSFTLTEMLRESAKAVSEDLSAIHDVTEVTNVLALNATIEAARAGAVGKGFAVVASEIRKHASTTKSAVEGISKNITVLLKTIFDLSKKMDAVKQEVDQAKQMVDNLVTANKYEISLVNSVKQEVSTLETTFNEYDVIKDTLNTMIKQSNISKEDIEKMLIVYQHNIKKTGEI